MNSFHPVSVFVFTALMVAEILIVSNPVFTVILLIGGISVYFITSGAKNTIKTIIFCGIMILLLTAVNPIFVHRGETPLFFLNGRAITLEALIYGFFSSIRLAAGLIWCKAFSEIMTNDKIYCLTGKISPKITAMLTTAVRFIPDMIKQGQKISRYSKVSGNYKSELKRLTAVFSALVTWSIENGIYTADSMKARGFELGGRTSYSRYIFGKIDGILCGLSFVSLIITIILSGRINFEFYPKIQPSRESLSLIITSVFAVGAFVFPIIFETVTGRKRGVRT